MSLKEFVRGERQQTMDVIIKNKVMQLLKTKPTKRFNLDNNFSSGKIIFSKDYEQQMQSESGQFKVKGQHEIIIFDDGGGGGQVSSIGLGSHYESQQEELFSSNRHYYLYDRPAPTGLLICDDSNKSFQLVCQGQYSGTGKGVKLNQRSKRIKKEKKPKNPKIVSKKPRKRKPRKERPLPKRIKDRLASGDFTYQRPRKNTPKRASIFPRAKLKQLGMNLDRFEEKRNRPGYLQVCFCFLYDLLSEEQFHVFMQDYRIWLKEETEWQQSLLDTYGDQVSQCYIQDFELARNASYMFEEKRQLDSLKIFFGTGRQGEYLGENIILYIEEVRWLFTEKNLNFPIPEFNELNKINQRSLYSLEKIMTQVEKLQAKENFIDDVLDLK